MMSNGGTLSRILHELNECGIGPIGERRMELLKVFVREVVLWSGRMHLVGKRNIRKTISDLTVDSWLLHRFAVERGGLESTVSNDAGRGAAKIADIGSGA